MKKVFNRMIQEGLVRDTNRIPTQKWVQEQIPVAKNIQKFYIEQNKDPNFINKVIFLLGFAYDYLSDTLGEQANTAELADFVNHFGLLEIEESDFDNVIDKIDDYFKDKLQEKYKGSYNFIEYELSLEKLKDYLGYYKNVKENVFKPYQPRFK